MRVPIQTVNNVGEIVDYGARANDGHYCAGEFEPLPGRPFPSNPRKSPIQQRVILLQDLHLAWKGRQEYFNRFATNPYHNQTRQQQFRRMKEDWADGRSVAGGPTSTTDPIWELSPSCFRQTSTRGTFASKAKTQFL